MPVPDAVCCFALKMFAGDSFGEVVRVVSNHYSDHGKKMLGALERSNRRAWKALEVALTGKSLWSRLTEKAESKAFHQQIRVFLEQMPLPELEDRSDYRRKCLRDLKAALDKGLLLGELVPGALLDRVGQLAAHGNPQAVLRQEKKALRQLALEIQNAGFTALGWLLDQPAQASHSVVVVAVRYFFRREVETNAELARGLQFTAMESLQESQDEAFRNLGNALDQAEKRLEEVLAEAQEQLLGAIDELKAAVVVSGEKLDSRLGNVQEDVQGLKANMEQLLARLDMLNAPVRPSHSLSIRTDREKQLVESLLADYRRLSKKTKDAQPDLATGMGKLQMAAGEFAGAETSFRHAGQIARTDAERAEAHHNAFRAALEQHRHTDALLELVEACTLDALRFAPFPLDRYEPIKLLGAGGFGVTFLCRHRLSKGQVAIKSLNMEDIDRDAGDILEEASALEELRHPAVIGMRDCGYVGGERGRPYLVMEYFEGQTLEQHIKKNGPLPLADALQIGRTLAEALRTAHDKRLLHRDVKPANILLRKGREGNWDVRVIDFGLALKQERLNDASVSTRRGKTLAGSAIAGTIDYAAPEQMGKLPGQRIGPPADIYGFGRTLNFALFGVPELTLHQYRTLPEPIADFLSHCIQPMPSERPKDFGEVLNRLRLQTHKTPSPPTRPKPETPIVLESAEDEDRPRQRRRVQERDDEDDARPRSRRRLVEHDDDNEDRLRSRHRGDDEHEDRPRSRSTPTSTGSRLTHAVLALLLGVFGVHKFAQDNSKSGVIRLCLILTCVGIWVNAFIGLIEAILYLTMSNEEYHRHYIVEKKGWF